MCLQCHCFHSQHSRACAPGGILPCAGDGPGQGWTKFMAHTHLPPYLTSSYVIDYDGANLFARTVGVDYLNSEEAMCFLEVVICS